jgi:uncharacterized membrane protein YhaH (DUF805 family)
MLWWLFSFQGRFRRTPYWLSVAIQWAIYFALTIVIDFNFLDMRALENGQFIIVSMPKMIIFAIYCLFSSWSAFAIGAKRLHDLNRSGWWQLFFLFLPIINILFLLYLGFAPTKEAPNQYGNPQPI